MSSSLTPRWPATVSASFAAGIDSRDRRHRLLGDVAVELGVALELLGHGAAQRLDRRRVLLGLGDLLGLGLEIGVVVEELRDPHPAPCPRPAPSRCRRAASGAAARWRARRRGRCPRPSARPRTRPSGWRAGSACRPSSPPRARAPTSRGRRRAARSCAETPRCRAAAGRDRTDCSILSWTCPCLAKRPGPGLSGDRAFPSGEMAHAARRFKASCAAAGVVASRT